MPAWLQATLGDLRADDPSAIAIGPFGSRMKADCYVQQGVPVIRGTNISDGRGWKGDWVYVSEETADSMPNCNVRAGDLVFPHRGAIGEVAIVPPEPSRYMLSTSLMKFTANPHKADPVFLFYYLRSAEGRREILTYSSQVGTPGIGQPLTSLKQFRVPRPPIAIQKAIARILTALDDKIELNRGMNETLENMARAIFKDWFIDFGPTRTKAGDHPGYLANEVWKSFPDALDKSDRPEGWSVGTLAQVADVNPESWSRSNYPDQIRYVDLANTKWGIIESTEALNKESAPSRAQRILRTGDTIVGTVRPGNGSYAYIGQDGLTGSTGFAVLRAKRPEYREFVYFSATSSENIQRLAHLADGAAYPAVRPEAVIGSPIAGYSAESLRYFSELTQPLLLKIEANKQESQTLTGIRNLLIPKLMSGDLSVKEADNEIEGVL